MEVSYRVAVFFLLTRDFENYARLFNTAKCYLVTVLNSKITALFTPRQIPSIGGSQLRELLIQECDTFATACARF